MSNVIPLNTEVRVGEFAITLTVPRATFNRMVDEVMVNLNEMLKIIDGYDYMRFFGNSKFDAKRILKMMDKANDAESTAYILAGLINSNDARPSAIKVAMYTLFNTEGADQVEVVASMYIIHQYFETKNQKFM